MMKVISTALVMLLVVGCASNSAPISAKPMVRAASAIVNGDNSVSGVGVVNISWVPNYVPGLTNEVTVIIGSPDLTIPREQWATVFVGATNRCEVGMTNAMYFFSAFNELR